MYIRSSSSPILDGCDFIGNIQEGNPTAGGGAVTMYGSGNGGGPCYPVFTDCEFIENRAQGYGGAVHAAYSGSPTMIDCQFTLNTSTAGGGAIAALGHIKAPTTVEIQDSIIEFNQTDGNGAGLDARTSTVIINNVSIMGNDAGMSGGGCSFNSSETSSLINSTICGNSPEQTFGVFQDNGGNTITDRCMKCVGDLTGDGSVDSADVGLLLADWNQDGPADLNGDSVVNSADLGLLLVKWGPC
jgi:predicted outer membrane repeat protein